MSFPSVVASDKTLLPEMNVFAFAMPIPQMSVLKTLDNLNANGPMIFAHYSPGRAQYRYNPTGCATRLSGLG
ncbi:MAG TPA: hypothetical protein IGS53_21495 [Leptolyngbyaceae cyanobacterium M33_DOE_097]|nr:hypothetical protein [Leptolyngbyaceae cyanobacterium M33_DOE_097]